MTEQEYFLKLRRLRQKLAHGKTAGVLEALEKLFAVKPVRLEWFVAKAEALLLLGAPKEKIDRVLQGKLYLGLPQPILRDFFQLQQRRIGEKNELDRQRQACLAALCSGAPLPEALAARLAKLRAALANTPLTPALFKEAAACYYMTNRLYLYLLLYLHKEQILDKDPLFAREWVKKRPNVGFLLEAVQRDAVDTFVLLESGDDGPDCQLAARLLAARGKRVFLLAQPAPFPVEHTVRLEDTVPICLAHAEARDGYTRLQPIALQKSGEALGDNRDLLLAHLALEASPKRLAAVLCSGELFDALSLRPALQKPLQRLSEFEADALNANLAFGYCGDYLSYLSLLYGFDARARLAAAPTCAFSIVVPARGDNGCLRHTLQTCLKQRYAGDYEILLSDNSPRGDDAVYSVYQALNDPRLRYVRTPRELPLPRSFEYAFLQARGAFVFAIGADDGVLPWALDTLAAVLDARPDLEFFSWERCFYAWPDEENPEANKCVLPQLYRKGNLCLREHDAKAVLERALYDPSLLYHLPFFYINAGYRKSYLQKFLEQTGRLWDGVCQDVYIGAANLAINDRFFCLEYPLTVAGSTSRSLGRQSNLAAHSDARLVQLDAQRLTLDNLGGYAASVVERFVPIGYTTDYASLCLSVLRLVARGALPLALVDTLDWQKIYALLARQLFWDDLALEKRLSEMRSAARRVGPALLQFVEACIVQPTCRPRRLPPRPKPSKYAEGRMADGSFVYDASRYGVRNIRDAVRFLENKTNL